MVGGAPRLPCPIMIPPVLLLITFHFPPGKLHCPPSATRAIAQLEGSDAQGARCGSLIADRPYRFVELSVNDSISITVPAGEAIVEHIGPGSCRQLTPRTEDVGQSDPTGRYARTRTTRRRLPLCSGATLPSPYPSCTTTATEATVWTHTFGAGAIGVFHLGTLRCNQALFTRRTAGQIGVNARFSIRVAPLVLDPSQVAMQQALVSRTWTPFWTRPCPRSCPFAFP